MKKERSGSSKQATSAEPATMAVTMTRGWAKPGQRLEKGRTYELPAAQAEYLVRVGGASPAGNTASATTNPET